MSTAVEQPRRDDTKFVPPKPPPQNWQLHDEVSEQRSRDVLVMLLAIRTLNAFTLGTFFQPDEFYQALEPAWALAFGPQSGAWLTWEWTHQLRSSVYPALLALPYLLVSGPSFALGFPATLRVQLLLLAPKVIPALSAATMDYFTWGLAERVYGKGSHESGAALGLVVLSPWQWFFSTRTFSNNIEATLTALALSFWPWDWMRSVSTVKVRADAGKNLNMCFLAVAFACILRPTNVLIWAVLSVFTLPHLNIKEILAMVQAGAASGSIVALGISTISDRIYYGNWNSSIYNFVRYNFTEGLADFYGLNRVDYYFTEAMPQLLTTALPFVLWGIVQAMLYKAPAKTADLKGASISRAPAGSVLRSLAAVALVVPVAFSLIGHKEVRFIYPILPVLIVLGARPTVTLFDGFPNPRSTIKKITFALVVAANIAIAIYFSNYYGRGVIDVHTYLRHEFESHNHKLVLGKMNQTDTINHMAIGFLMPCHSTPWRSRLVWPEIDAWALTCEPPVGLDAHARASYVDEADAFYADPASWLRQELRPLPLMVAEKSSAAPSSKREWPEYVVFFQQLEDTMKKVFQGSGYEECWRGFNTRWHYDWRRAGDVVVYCEDRGTKAELVIEKEDMDPFMQFV